MAKGKPCFVVERIEWDEDLMKVEPTWEDRAIIGVFSDKASARDFIEEDAEDGPYPCRWRVGSLVYSGRIEDGFYVGGVRYEILRSIMF